MAVASLSPASVAVRRPARTCCADRADDARVLAAVVASGAPSGLVLDVGCGSGAVAHVALRARPDFDVIGIDVSASRCRDAERRAASTGLSDRFRTVAGSTFEVDLPRSLTVVANPPMLPTEPAFAFVAAEGRRELFWMRLLATVSGWDRPVQLWLHLFDFQGVGAPSGESPTISQIAESDGFSVGIAHRCWRALAPTSSVTKALPALRRAFPKAAPASAERWAGSPTSGSIGPSR
jgi:SAM-dependent methyltransferase